MAHEQCLCQLSCMEAPLIVGRQPFWGPICISCIKNAYCPQHLPPHLHMVGLDKGARQGSMVTGMLSSIHGKPCAPSRQMLCWMHWHWMHSCVWCFSGLCGPCCRLIIIITKTIAQIYECFAGDKDGQIKDPEQALAFHIIKSIDDNATYCHATTIFPWWMALQDFVLFQYWQLEQDGSYIVSAAQGPSSPPIRMEMTLFPCMHDIRFVGQCWWYS